MVKNFLVKKGDQLSFTITFTSSLPIANIEWGIKKAYTDEVYTILKTLNNGISKVSDYVYQFTLTPAETTSLDYYNYPYDIRITVGNTVKTPLSGKLFIKETVFEVVNG